jgi:hypothetical protein
VDLIAIVDYEPEAAHLARAEQSSPRGAHYKDAQGLVNPDNRWISCLSKCFGNPSPPAGLVLTKDHPALATELRLH